MPLATAEITCCLHKIRISVLPNEGPSATVELHGDSGFLKEPMWEESDGFGGAAATAATGEKLSEVVKQWC